MSKRRAALYTLIAFLLLTLLSFVLLYYLTPIFKIDQFKEKPKCEIKVKKYSLIGSTLTMNLEYKNCKNLITITLKDKKGNVVCSFNTFLENPISVNLVDEDCDLTQGEYYTIYINGKPYFSVVYLG